MSTTKSDFDNLDETGNTDLCDDTQWNALARAVRGLSSVWSAKDAVVASEPNDILNGVVFGDFGGSDTLDQRLRATNDSGRQEIAYARNTGSDGSPVWDTLFSYGEGAVANAGSFSIYSAGVRRWTWEAGAFGQYTVNDIVNSKIPFGIAADTATSTLFLNATGAVFGETIFTEEGSEAIELGTSGASIGSGGAASNILRMVVNSATKVDVGLSSVTFSDPLLAPNGSVSLPAYAFSNDPDLGLYRIGANVLGISAGGVKALEISEGAAVVNAGTGDSALILAKAGTEAWEIRHDDGTGNLVVRDKINAADVATIVAGADADTLTIDVDGNVGIDQPIPVEKLHVTGAIAYDPPFTTLSIIGNQSIPSATWTPIVWDNEIRDDDGIFTSPSADIDIQVAGFYQANVIVAFQANATGVRAVRYAVAGGVFNTAGQTAPAMPVGELTKLTCPYDRDYTTGASGQFRIEVYQNSGGNLNIQAGSTATAWFIWRIA